MHMSLLGRLSSAPPLTQFILIILSALVFFALPLAVWRPTLLHPLSPILRTQPVSLTLPPLHIATLSFGSFRTDQTAIEHNCALIHPTHHIFEIHTDNLTRPYCKVCTCVPFERVRCPCPDPGQVACSHCEKLRFVVNQITHNSHVLFLDSDLIILRPDFLPRMQARVVGVDALATRGHDPARAGMFYQSLNSGLLFLRRLPGVDYEGMMRLMYEIGTNRDQYVISRFLFEHYTNWDELSLRWHCRYLKKRKYDIPLSECYTLHDRSERAAILGELNYTLSKVE